MDTTNIEVASNPSEVAALIGPDAGTVDPTFQQTLAQIEADKVKKAEDAKKLAELNLQVEEKNKPKVKPLQLKYTYEGNHSCGNTVKTIMITTGGVLTATGFCISCDETVSQIEVQPINNPIPGPENPEKVSETAPKPKDDVTIAKDDTMVTKKDKR